MVERRVDLLIFGASGLTGKHAIPFVHRISKSKSLTWGVAGRSEDKLKEVLRQKGEALGDDLSHIPIILADVSDDASLLDMARQTKVLLNCCGPFRSFGRPVVEACLKAGTHQVDVNGEPQYMEKLYLDKQEEAQKEGVYVLSACGLDSIPCDMGIIRLQREFGGVLNSVVTYFEDWHEGERIPGIAGNYTTWESSITASANWSELRDVRRQLFRKKLPNLEPKLCKRFLPFKTDLADGWMVRMPGPDHSVVERTQRYLFETESKRPVQVDCFYSMKNLRTLIWHAVLYLLFSILCRFELGRRILLDYSEIFSAGTFKPNEIPSQKKLDNILFRMTFCGEGWIDHSDDKDTQYSKPCDGRIVAQIKGRNPWYGITALCMVAAGVTVLTESEKMPGRGGCYPPGVAFADTSILNLLDQNGMTFEVVSKEVI